MIVGSAALYPASVWPYLQGCRIPFAILATCMNALSVLLLDYSATPNLAGAARRDLSASPDLTSS